jgi:hypothetical protein
LKQVALLLSKRNQFSYAARPCASACRGDRHTARRAAHRRLLRLAQARRRLLHLRHASGCFGTSRGLSCDSSSTTPPTPRVRVPRHVAWLIAPLGVDYSASRGLVVDFFASAVRPGASARRAAHHAARRATRRRLLHLAQARRRLLRLRRTTGCLGTSRGSSRGSSCRSLSTTPRRAGSSSTTPPRAGSSSTTSPPSRVRVPRQVARLVTPIVARLVIDYFAYEVRLGASARRAAHCFSSTTSPTPRDRVPRHFARLVAWLVAPLVVDYSASCRLVIDYFAYTVRPGASARRAAHHAARHAARRRLLRVVQARCRQLRLAQARRRLLRLRRTSGCMCG